MLVRVQNWDTMGFGVERKEIKNEKVPYSL